MNISKRIGVFACSLLLVCSSAAFAQQSDELTTADLAALRSHAGNTPDIDRILQASGRGHGKQGANSGNQVKLDDKKGIPGIDSLVNFSGKFDAPGVDSNGVPTKRWFYNMIGRNPEETGTTMIGAPIVPVSVQLLDFDGSNRIVNGINMFSDVTPFVQPTLMSPVFQNNWYTSSDVPTQFTDAVQRAEFFEEASPKWHTLLAPSVKPGLVMKLPRGTYQFARNPDGTCCAFILLDSNTFVNLLFPPTAPVDNTTTIGAAELNGSITTKDLSTFLFPNLFLFSGNVNNCCILGFHSFDVEPGDANNGNRERRFVINYSSWISPGLFGDAFTDVTATSHEVAEAYNDPFVVSDGIHGLTPWWLAPNGVCQNNMETGDVIEGLSNATFPITMNGFTYHPQNEALLQWFEFKKRSNAIQHAYSYPDTTVLPTLSPFENVNCQ
jgi:hypothetical protein